MEKYNRLTVLEVIGRDSHSKKIVRCKCDCGSEYIGSLPSIKKGNTKSCGCIRKEKPNSITHNLRNTGLYDVWANIKQRCLNPKNPSYKYYGERGIELCNDWESNFESFYLWAVKNGYKKSLTIDRIDNNKGYCPENCRLITHKENCRNQNQTIIVEYNGKKISLQKLCEDLNLKYSTVSQRLFKLKKPLDIALSKGRLNRNKLY